MLSNEASDLIDLNFLIQHIYKSPYFNLQIHQP
jgi:hypothetical protein